MLRLYDNTASESLARVEVPEVAVILPVETTVEDPALTPFLDGILQRLSSLPASMHEEIRRELRVHLESLIVAHEELGADRADAVLAAIGQFGDPATLARRFRHSYESTLPIATPWAAMRAAMLVFGVGMPIYVAAVASDPQFPEFTPLSMSTLMLWVFPILAGSGIGWRIPRRAALGILYGIAALTTLILPLLLNRAYQVGNMTTTDTLTDCTAIVNLIQCVVCWLPLGCLAAAVSSHTKATSARGIETLPVFIVYAMGIALLASMAETKIQVGLLNTHVLSPYSTLFLMESLSLLLSWAGALWAGRQIGKTWPSLETWTRKPLTYLLGGALAMAIGSLIIPTILCRELGWQQPVASHFSTPAACMTTLIDSFFLWTLPMVGLTAVVTASKARGETPRLMRGVSLAAFCYLALKELYLCLFSRLPTHLHQGAFQIPPYMTLFDYILPVAFIAVLWANRRQLPRPHWLNRLRI